MVKYHIITERYIINDNDYLNNTIMNANPNINIITSSSIHNNIIKINSIPNKKGENNINLNKFFFLNKTPLKINMKGNVKPKKEFETFSTDNDETYFNEDDDEYDNYKYNNKNKDNKIIIKYGRNDNSNINSNINSNSYHNKIFSIFFSKANNLKSKSHYSLCRIKSNNNKHNNHKMMTIRQGEKRQNEKIISNITNGSNSLF